VARNDLDPEQRAILLRRAKKLEQLLGEALDERSIERLLIDPIHASRTVTTRLAETDEAWPDSPTGTMRRGGKEEWTKEDVVPRKGKAVDPPSNGLVRSGSILARTARAALGMGGEKKNDLAVYVSREIRVSETGVRGAKPRPRHSASTPPGRETLSLAAMLRDGPVSSTRAEESDANEDDSARRTRRLQLAKVHPVFHTSANDSFIVYLAFLSHLISYEISTVPIDPRHQASLIQNNHSSRWTIL